VLRILYTRLFNGFKRKKTNNIVEFKGDCIQEFLGTIDEFLEKKKVDGFRQFEQDKTGANQTGSSNHEKVNAQPKKEVKSASLAIIEKKIEKLEADIKACESKMATPEFLEKASMDSSEYDPYNKLKKQLSDLMSEWESML
jgi:ATP-binding cassette subfamily F protein 3